MNRDEVVIEAGRSARRYWDDLWRFRGLFVALAWRDVLVRYKQALLGASWAVIRPALTVAVFAFVFGKVAALPSGGVPYVSFVLVAMLPWLFFAGSFSDMSTSLIQNENMISKAHFPRVLVPLSALLVNAADLAVAAGLAGPWLFVAGGGHWGPRLAALPALLLLAALAAVGLGLWCSALNVRYRDFRYVVPFAVQFGLFVTPVGYALAVVPQRYRAWYDLNPMVGVVEGVRWAVFGGAAPGLGQALARGGAVAALAALTGWGYFRAVEGTMADRI